VPRGGFVYGVVELLDGRGQRFHKVRAIQRELPAVSTPVGVGVVVEVLRCGMLEHRESVAPPIFNRDVAIGRVID